MIQIMDVSELKKLRIEALKDCIEQLKNRHALSDIYDYHSFVDYTITHAVDRIDDKYRVAMDLTKYTPIGIQGLIFIEISASYFDILMGCYTNRWEKHELPIMGQFFFDSVRLYKEYIEPIINIDCDSTSEDRNTTTKETTIYHHSCKETETTLKEILSQHRESTYPSYLTTHDTTYRSTTIAYN